MGLASDFKLKFPWPRQSRGTIVHKKGPAMPGPRVKPSSRSAAQCIRSVDSGCR